MFSSLKRLSNRRQLVWIASALFCVYVGTYVSLSRRGMADAAELNAQGWMYVSRRRIEHDLDNDNSDFTRQHQMCRLAFLPLSWIDVKLFGNPPPYIGGIWRLT